MEDQRQEAIKDDEGSEEEEDVLARSLRLLDVSEVLGHLFTCGANARARRPTTVS